jgi:hypothetical protein
VSIAQVRKAVVAALGAAATVIVLVPEGMVPDAWRPWVGLVLAAATVAGVYRAPNAPPVRHGPGMTRIADPAERPRPPFDPP